MFTWGGGGGGAVPLSQANNFSFCHFFASLLLFCCVFLRGGGGGMSTGGITGADLENGKGGFFCMHTLRAGENFSQPRPFLLKGLTECKKVLLTS